jgi:tryptophan 7-halogenase
MGIGSVSGPIERVVIVGGGTAGWMAAAALARLIPTGASITLVESDEIGTVGVGEATIPPIRSFNAMLGIDENEFVTSTGGSFKLGIEFVDWGRIGDRYLHPFGPFGFDIEGVRFHQVWRKLHAAGKAQDIHAYSLSAVVAAAGRFQPHDPDPASVRSQLNHAYHFDAALYAAFLRQRAEADGVRRVEGQVVETQVQPETGLIEAVRLEDGRTLAGDLFIDCSGFRALLIGDAMGVPYESWAQWLPCDRAVAVPTRDEGGEILPYTRATAAPAGWRWRIPLQERVGNGYVYSSEHVGDTEAAAHLLDHVEGKPLAEPRQLRFVAGRRREVWRGNCVALGLASGFLEPLESTSIHLIQAGISRLLALFPERGCDGPERDEYNRLANVQIEQIRDFIIIHYKATARDDTAFWRRCRDMDVPDTLARKIELFRSRGRLFRYEDELFADASWIAVLLGQGVIPKGWDRMADTLDASFVEARLAKLAAVFAQAAAGMPRHAEYLARHCPVRKAEPR